MLFRPEARFVGLPREGFAVFAIPDRHVRRRAIMEAFHAPLAVLGQDLLEALGPGASRPLHTHLPRLDWPRGYQPFCTWLALSHDSHGYQGNAQLNVGVHADHVAIRLGWDVSADAFGRFEFLCRHGEPGRELVALAAAHAELAFRVYAAAGWPQGSELVFESRDAIAASFDEVRRRGVWWELGQRLPLAAHAELITSSALGRLAERVFGSLLPMYERLVAGSAARPP